MLIRIREKIEVLLDRVEFIESHAYDDWSEDRILRKAMYKEFQEAAEAASDISAMIRRCMNSSAKDDYSNIDFLIQKDILDRELGSRMKEINGLRNRLVHGYDDLDDERACHAIQSLIKDLSLFSEVVLCLMMGEELSY